MPIVKSLLLSLGVVVICLGQGAKSSRPDLNGTWEFDRSRSNVGQSTNSANPPEQITIAYHEPEFRVTRKTVSNGQPDEKQFVYYTDGRGETNPTTHWLTTNPRSQAGRPRDTQSTTRWNGKKIVTRSTSVLTESAYPIEFQITVEWQVSSDGKTLTQTTSTAAHLDPSSSAVFVAASGTDFKAVYKLISK